MIDLSYIIPDMKARNMKETINIKYNNKTYVIPKPFNQCYFGSEPTKEMTIFNRFSNNQQSAKLPAFAVAIYDTIIGAEQTEDYKLMQTGLTWFQKNFTEEYYTLLD
tara:strand:+ start:224 stop:544 length:321 start_codon:yes stop_codon:yes gene_type:complete